MIDDLQRERDFWGLCNNTYFEESKHFVYAKLMGLNEQNNSLILDKPSKILDIGGGPVSMLLKTNNLASGTVVDPIEFPRWTVDRYKDYSIDVVVEKGEYINLSGYDEVWIYNVLKDTIDPEKIISNAKKAAPIIRVFEWVDLPSGSGKHELTEDTLNAWIGQKGKTVQLSQRNCYGKAYFGKFEGWS